VALFVWTSKGGKGFVTTLFMDQPGGKVTIDDLKAHHMVNHITSLYGSSASTGVRPLPRVSFVLFWNFDVLLFLSLLLCLPILKIRLLRPL